MHSFCPSPVYSSDIDASQSDTTLQFTESFGEVEDIVASKSDYDVPSAIPYSMSWLAKLVKRKSDKKEIRAIVEVESQTLATDLSDTTTARDAQTEESSYVPSEITKKRAKTTTPSFDIQNDLKKPKLDTLPGDISINPLNGPRLSAYNTYSGSDYTDNRKREFEDDENSHYNEREAKRRNAATTTPLFDTRPDIKTSSERSTYVNDDDDDIDDEVAMLMDKGGPPTVREYRLMPEHYVPRLIQQREIEELARKPLLCCSDGSYQQFSTPLMIRRNPNKEAIKILNPWPCLYRNKKFGELKKIGSLNVEDSPAFWRRPSC